MIGFESNDELGLDLRSSIGAGFGRYLTQTNLSELALKGGLVGTAESLKQGTLTPTSPSSEESLEGMLALDYSPFVYDHPAVAVAVSARLSAFPSITESGRTRAQLDLSYYNSYDSDPPSSTQSTSDYGVITLIGYSF